MNMNEHECKMNEHECKMNEHECKMNEHECKMNEHECKMNEHASRREFSYFGHHGSRFTRKKDSVWRPRVFSCLNSGVPELLHVPTT